MGKVIKFVNVSYMSCSYEHSICLFTCFMCKKIKSFNWWLVNS